MDFLQVGIVLGVTVAVSVLSLILLVAPFNYVFFFFGIAVICILFIYLEHSRLEYNEKELVDTNRKSLFSSFIDWVLVGSSLVLLFSNLFGIQENIFLMLVTLLIAGFGCGYCLLNLAKATSYFSKLELLVFSFIFSVLISGLLFFSGLILPPLRNYILFLAFLVLAVSSAIKNRLAPNNDSQKRSFSQKNDLLLLGLAGGFYVILFVFIFSNGFATITTDATHFYRLSVMLPRTPSLFYATDYVLFILFQSSILSLSRAGLELSQLVLGFLPILLIPTFYMMAKEYFNHVDKRLPSMSTIFWVLFAFGLFGWVYYLGLALDPANGLSLLGPVNPAIVYDKLCLTAFYTYYSTTYGIVGYTFVGFTVSIIAFLAALFLIKRTNIPKLLFYGLFSSLMVTMFLSHISEAVVFTVFLVLWGLVGSKNTSIRVNEAIDSTLIAFVAVLAFFGVASQILVVFWTLPLILSFVLPILLLVGAVIYRRINVANVRILLKNSVLRNKYRFSLIFLFLYAVSSITCLFSIGDFNIGQLGGVWNVPWFVYPLVLGFNGLLSVFACIVITRNPKLFGNYVFFLVFFLYCLVFARLVSVINLNFFFTSYWESRFIYYMEISLALIAPILMIKLFTVLRQRISKPSIRVFLTVIILSLIVEGGALTTFMNVEYWSLRASYSQPSGNELVALTAYSNLFNADPFAGSGSVTGDSLEKTSIAAPTAMLPFQDQTLIWSAGTPENPLRILGNPALSHFYLYLHNRDVNSIVANGWAQGYLNSELPMLPIVFSGSEVTIYNFSRVSPPLPHSDQILVLPFSSNQSVSESQYFCYDLLSNGLYNYTTAFDTDIRIMEAKTLLLSFDPNEIYSQNRPVQDYVDYVNSGGNLVVFNPKGFGFFGNLLFDYSRDDEMSTLITSSNQNITLPNGIFVEGLQPINSNEKTLSSYVCNSGTSAFITQVSLGEGNLFYVNVAPLVEYLKEPSSNKSAIYQVSGELLKEIGLTPFVFKTLPPVGGYVGLIQLNGAVSVKTESIWYQVDSSSGGAIGEMQVTSAQGISTFENVSSIRLTSASKVTLNSSQLVIKSGAGFYSILEFNDNCYARFNPEAQLLIHSNGQNSVVSNVSSLSSSGNNNLVIWGRTPTIAADYGSLNNSYTIQGLSGDNLAVKGGLSFTVQTSDGFSLLENLKVNGSSINLSQNYYNEFTSLPLGLTVGGFLFVATILLIIIRIIKRKAWLQKHCETSLYLVNFKFKTPKE